MPSLNVPIQAFVRRRSITVQSPNGSLSEIVTFALDDLGDSGNNHNLCLDVAEFATFLLQTLLAPIEPLSSSVILA